MSAVKVSFYAKNEHPVFSIEFVNPKTKIYMGYTVYNNGDIEEKTENGVEYTISFNSKSVYKSNLIDFTCEVMEELGFDVRELLVKRGKYDYLY